MSSTVQSPLKVTGSSPGQDGEPSRPYSHLLLFRPVSEVPGDPKVPRVRRLKGGVVVTRDSPAPARDPRTLMTIPSDTRPVLDVHPDIRDATARNRVCEDNPTTLSPRPRPLFMGSPSPTGLTVPELFEQESSYQRHFLTLSS